MKDIQNSRKLTNLIEEIVLEKMTVAQLVKNSPSLYGTRKFVTVLTSARILSQINPIHIFCICYFRISFNIIPSSAHSSPKVSSLQYMHTVYLHKNIYTFLR